MNRVVSFAALAWLAGCASATRASPGTEFDGTYSGAAQLVGFSSPDWQCDWTALPITVRNNRFHADVAGAQMTVGIRADGTFSAYAARNIYRKTRYLQVVHITGRIANGMLDATVRNARCNFRLLMRHE
jgi:hypothetical protein